MKLRQRLKLIIEDVSYIFFALGSCVIYTEEKKRNRKAKKRDQK